MNTDIFNKSVLIATSYLPSVSYIKKLLHCENVSIEACENYPKQTPRNRTFIYGSNGPLSLTIPVKKKDFFYQATKDIKIDYSTNWQKIHWRSIVSAYNSSPFFMYFDYLFEPFYNKQTSFLLDFNMAQLDVILNNILKLNISITETKNFELINYNLNDLRYLCSCKNFSGLNNEFKLEKYYQVFAEKHGFIANLSIIDLLFNEGKASFDYLKNDGIIVG